MSENKIIVGRRKTSVARLILTKGKGNFLVNKQKMEDYFKTDELRTIVLQALELIQETKKYDVKVNVQGGGVKGQAEAIRLAIARAIVDDNPEHKTVLKKESFLTRDSRMVERKKYGRRKARRRFQFSKR